MCLAPAYAAAPSAGGILPSRSGYSPRSSRATPVRGCGAMMNAVRNDFVLVGGVYDCARRFNHDAFEAVVDFHFRSEET